MRNSENFKNYLSDNVISFLHFIDIQGIRMNYESEALIFYHDTPEENIQNLSYFLKNRISHNYLGARSKKNFILILFYSSYRKSFVFIYSK